MFKELAPLLRHRSVLFTVCHLGDDQFRVNVVPKKIGDSENAALTIPLSVSGTAEDLDGQIGPTLVDFVSGHLELKNTLDRAKAEMDAAAKAAQAEARNKSKNQPAKKEAQVAATTKPAAVEAPVPRKTEPATPSLFDVASESSPIASVKETSAAGVSTSRNQLSEEDQEILAEIRDANEDEGGIMDEDVDDAA
jgi:PRTRC genetic system protein E